MRTIALFVLLAFVGGCATEVNGSGRAEASNTYSATAEPTTTAPTTEPTVTAEPTTYVVRTPAPVVYKKPAAVVVPARPVVVSTTRVSVPLAGPVYPGAFCARDKVGSTGYTSAGTKMLCSSDGSDQPRWKSVGDPVVVETTTVPLKPTEPPVSMTPRPRPTMVQDPQKGLADG